MSDKPHCKCWQQSAPWVAPPVPVDKPPAVDEDAVRPGQVVEGREYLGHGCWCHQNKGEGQLRDR